MARNQRYLKRLISTNTFADASRVIVQVDRNHDLATLLVEVTASVVVSNDYTAAKVDAPCQLLSSIKLKANGIKTLFDLPGTLAYGLGILREGNLPTLTAPPITVTTATTSFAFLIDLQIADGVRPKDSHFPTRSLTSFDLEMTFGSGDDLYTVAGDGASTFTGTVKVFAVQMQEYVGKDGKFTLPKAVPIRSYMEIPFETTQSAYLQRIPSRKILRGLLIRAHTLDVVSNSILNNVIVKLANETIIDLSATAIRTLNRTSCIGTMPTGYYFVDFADNGNSAVQMSNALDLRGNVDLDLVLDVTGAASTKLQVVPVEYEDFRPSDYGLVM